MDDSHFPYWTCIFWLSTLFSDRPMFMNHPKKHPMSNDYPWSINVIIHVTAKSKSSGLKLRSQPPPTQPLSWAPSLGLQGTWQMISVDIWPHAVPAPSSFWARASRCLGEQMAILRDKWWKQQKLRYQEICDMNHEWNMYIYIYIYLIIKLYIYMYTYIVHIHTYEYYLQ